MPKALFDISEIDLSQTHLSREDIEKINPHRFEFHLLDRVISMDHDKRRAVGIVPVRGDQFWVKGHIPGRPLFPGVLQVEAAAQLCSVLAHQTSKELSNSKDNFFGFIGVNQVRFRRQVGPGEDLIFLAELTDERRVISFETQGYVDGKLVFSGQIQGSHI